MNEQPDKLFDSGRDAVSPHEDRTPLSSVAALVAAGLPLGSGLRALSEEAPTHRLRTTLLRMSDELAAGAPPDDVLAGGGRGLPHYVRGLVRSGVQSGQLGRFLEEFLLTYRRRRATRLQYWLALAYPVLLLPFSLLVAFGILAMVVPQFKDIFYDFGISLPTLTLVVIRVADFLRPPVLGGCLILILLSPLFLQLLSWMFGPTVWTRFVQSVPVVGTPSRMRGMSEFCSLLGLLVSGGIPLGEALNMTADAVNDSNLKAGSRLLAKSVDAGERMQDGARQLPHFSAELRSLFHWERREQAFGDMLRQASGVFAARSQVQIGMVFLVFQPVLLLVIGGLIGLIVIALLMPLIKLLNELT